MPEDRFLVLPLVWAAVPEDRLCHGSCYQLLCLRTGCAMALDMSCGVLGEEVVLEDR